MITATTATLVVAAHGNDEQVQFVRLNYGVDRCDSGLEITSREECQMAVELLSLGSLQPWVSSSSNAPPGCAVRESGDSPRWHFNTGAMGTGRPDLAPICKAHGSVPLASLQALNEDHVEPISDDTEDNEREDPHDDLEAHWSEAADIIERLRN